MKIFNKIKLWWKFEGKYYHKDFIQGLKNYWKWSTVVWHDRDGDYHYIYEMLRFKLEKQAYYIFENGHHVDSHRTAEVMLLCARLCQIQTDELYETEYLDYVKTDHEFIPLEDGKFFEVNSTVTEDNLDEYFAKYPRQYKRALQGEIAWWGNETDPTDRKVLAICIAWDNQQRSRKLLFDIMNNRISGWWD
jgi:hypothetical protein